MSAGASNVAWQRARHEHARLALEQVLVACGDRGIDVLPVKGILTAHLFYQDPGLRPIQDVDLRIRPQDVGSVVDVGSRSGWRLLSRSRAYGTLAFDVAGFLVEFESHVGPPGLCDLRVEDMLRRSSCHTGLFGIPHRQPELHDHALLMCVNAFKDKLIDALPGAVRDLELLPGLDGFSLEKLAALSRDVGAATILSIVAEWLVSARGASAWQAVRAARGSSQHRRIYVALFERAIRSDPRPGSWIRLLARIGADGRHQRLRALGAMALRAGEEALGLARTKAPPGERRGPSSTRAAG